MDVLYRIILFSAAVNNAWERRVCTPHLRSSLCPEPCWRPLLDILTCQECGSASEPPNYWPLLHEFPSALLPLSLPPSSLMHPVVFLFLVCALTVLLPLFCLCHVSLLLLFSPPPPPHPLSCPPLILVYRRSDAPSAGSRPTDWLILSHLSLWMTHYCLRMIYSTHTQRSTVILTSSGVDEKLVSKGSVKHANLRERKSCSYIRGLHLTHLSLEA